MSGMRKRLGYVGVPFVFGLAAVPAAAQSSGNAPESEQASSSPVVAEVVVTAQRREQRLSDVGMTVSSLDGNFLVDRKVNSAADLTQVVSAFSVAEGVDGTPVYTLRGVGFNATSLGAQPTVSIYYDEAPLPYGPLTQGPLFDLARVEVLKGPQGTLYGQNSTGGAINYIVNKPTDTFEAGVRADFGRFDTVEGNGFISGPLSNTLSGRLALSAQRSGDWQESYLRNDSIGRQERYAARMLLDWEPSDRVRAQINLNGWVDRSDNQVPMFVEPVPRVPENALPELWTLPAGHGARAADWDEDTEFRRDNEQWQAVARFDIDVSDHMMLTSLSNYARVIVDSRYDNDATAFDLADVTTTGRVEVFSQELRLSGDFRDGAGNYLVGVYYQTDSIEEGSFVRFNRLSSTVNISSPPLPPPGLGNLRESENIGDQTNEALGFFGNLEWAFTDQLTAIVGARYTEAEHRNRSCTADTGNGDWASVTNGLIGLLSGTPGTLQPGECVTLDSDLNSLFERESFREDNLSWRAGLNYKPGADSLIYGVVSRGYKAGNFPVINAIARSSLRPVTQEELTAYEVGLKASIARAVRVEASAYYYDYKDKQLLTNTLDPVFGLVPVLGNVPSSHSYGADLQLTATPVSGLLLQSAMAYQKTSIGPFGDYDVFGTPVDLKGNSFNFAPDWTVSGDAEYRFDVARSLEAFVGANITYNSETFADLAESPLMRIRPYTVLGLRAGVGSADGAWVATIWGKNVTDETYWTNAGLGYDSLYRVMGRPATYGVSFSYNIR